MKGKNKKIKQKNKKEAYHWADGITEQLIKRKPKSGKVYTCFSAITPSGAVHIGNFREIFTNELVARALKDKGKKVRFIHSWDDFDRFRKVPANLARQNLLKDYLFMPISVVPDPFDCHKSYAEHFEKEFEAELPKLGIKPEILYQSKKFQACEYTEEIKFVLQNREKIKSILEKYKTEKITKEWWPVQIYCEACMKDTTTILSWDKNYILEYKCGCGNAGKVNFSKKGIVKVPWRVDWPMRSHYEKVDFEPGGKEHSTPGGSRDTTEEILEKVYNVKPSLYLMYDYIIIKGIGGKMSSSLGNVITPKQCLEIYEPQVLRYLFVSTRPNTEFSISFDQDVLKVYAEYDELEEKYFSKKLDKKQQRIYELSQVKESKTNKPKKIFASSFRQLTEMVQLKSEKEILDFYKKEIKKQADKERIFNRIKLAKNWLNYAPEQFKFRIQERIKPEIKKKLSKEQIAVLKEFSQVKSNQLSSEEQIMKKVREVCANKGIKPKRFFQAAYLVLFGKESGPRLSTIIILEKEEILKLLKSV